MESVLNDILGLMVRWVTVGELLYWYARDTVGLERRSHEETQVHQSDCIPEKTRPELCKCS